MVAEILYDFFLAILQNHACCTVNILVIWEVILSLEWFYILHLFIYIYIFTEITFFRLARRDDRSSSKKGMTRIPLLWWQMTQTSIFMIQTHSMTKLLQTCSTDWTKRKVVSRPNNANFSGSQNDNTSSTTPEVCYDEYKFPRETVSELNGRIEQTSVSPFDRFRSQRGILSVTPILSRSDLRLPTLWVWIGVG